MFIGDGYAMFNVRLPDLCRRAMAQVQTAYCPDNTPAFPAQFARMVAIQGLPQRRKDSDFVVTMPPNPAMDSDTYSAPLERALSNARHCER
jgi:hypothetical protein